MKYRKMGNLDWDVSALGFGCMRLPKKKVIFMKRVDVPEAVKIIRSGIDQGINYVDTAWGYHMGRSEGIVGKALQNGYREKVHLTTKLPIWLIKKESDFDVYLKRQLKRLQTDYLDIYLIHAMNKKRFETVKKFNLEKKMEEAKESGLIKHAGFSFHGPYSLFREIVDYHPWDVCQIQYNYIDTHMQATTAGLEYAASKGMAVIIMEPIKGGKLANPPEEANKIMAMAENTRTPVDWALQFLWNRPEVSVVLSGMGSQQMVDENCHSADVSGINCLTGSDLETVNKLAQIFNATTVVPCTACEYCIPCPEGVGIPQNFSIINEAFRSKDITKALTKYKKLASSPKGLNREKTNGNASLCVKCGHCLDKCPQSINIPDELEKIQEVMEHKKPINSIF